MSSANYLYYLSFYIFECVRFVFGVLYLLYYSLLININPSECFLHSVSQFCSSITNMVYTSSYLQKKLPSPCSLLSYFCQYLQDSNLPQMRPLFRCFVMSFRNSSVPERIKSADTWCMCAISLQIHKFSMFQNGPRAYQTRINVSKRVCI